MEKSDEGQCCRRNLKRTSRKRHQMQSECNNGIRNQGLKEQLCQRRRTLNKTFRHSVDLEIAKQSGLPLDCVSERRGWVPHPKTKEETTNNRLRAMDVGALTTHGTFPLKVLAH
jgi:hypothetical protein